MKNRLDRKSAPRRKPSPPDDIDTAGWDESIRSAFLEGCVLEGVRAGLAHEALAVGASDERQVDLGREEKGASLNAALGWLRIETCLARYGELAALALARCIDELTLEYRQREETMGRAPFSISPPVDWEALDRPSQETANSKAMTLEILQRGRDRLARFWQANGASAA